MTKQNSFKDDDEKNAVSIVDQALQIFEEEFGEKAKEKILRMSWEELQLLMAAQGIAIRDEVDLHGLMAFDFSELQFPKIAPETFLVFKIPTNHLFVVKTLKANGCRVLVELQDTEVFMRIDDGNGHMTVDTLNVDQVVAFLK